MMARPVSRRRAQAGDARLDFRRQPDRLPGRLWRPSRPSRPTACSSAEPRSANGSASHFEAIRAGLPDLVRDIRIKGTMIGLDLTFDATNIVAECMSRRLLINATHGHVVRLLPALTITDDQIDQGCAILADVLRQAVD